MSKLTLLIGLVVAQMAISASYSINIALKVEEQESLRAISPTTNPLLEGLIEDLGRSYKQLASCGFSEIMQCSAKIEEAVADCVKHPDVTQCIMEILGADSECKDCIKVICRALHIPGCM
eukprot:TRINITY_DN13612_c0_g1_i1.p1 TRINITY_DN13612_c0_g1~~TRINITY_DN13612_c0_g1_i1.p1  ORF type:complete len:120 (+),score=20.58 TRINITY_DN13612_c0_g1_i1:31-390(+)